MPAKNLLSGIILLFCSFFYSAVSGQSAYNPNILPLGDKEALMANTGAGGLKSTGAVFYNPAALTMLKGRSFSLSGSAYMRFQFKANPVAIIEGVPLDYEGSGYRSIPTSAVSVRQFRDWHLAFSALIPVEFTFEGTRDWNIPLEDVETKLKMIQNYQERMLLIGFSAARSLGEDWSLGISVYGQAYKYLSTIDLRGTIIGSPDFLLQSTRRQKVTPVNLLTILGLQRRWEKWNFGLRVAVPSIYLFGKGDFYDYNFSNFAGLEEVESSETDISDVKARFRTPWDVRLGISYLAEQKLLFAFDVSYGFGQSYQVYDDPRLPFEEQVKGNFRVSGGIEYFLGKRKNFSLHAGGSYTPSVKEEEVGNVGQDFWAGFTGVKVLTKHVDTTLGFFYSYGEGTGELSTRNGQTTQSYEYLGLFLGTNYKF